MNMSIVHRTEDSYQKDNYISVVLAYQGCNKFYFYLPQYFREVLARLALYCRSMRLERLSAFS
jgi:hypothetical protein